MKKPSGGKVASTLGRVTKRRMHENVVREKSVAHILMFKRVDKLFKTSFDKKEESYSFS